MKAAEALVIVVGGQEYWAPTSSQGLRMAEAFRRAGCAVLYLECGGDGAAFRERSRRLKDVSPGVFRHPEHGEFFLGRMEPLPFMRLSWPDWARRAHCRAGSRTAERFLRSDAAGGRKVLVAHYGWFLPEFLAGSETRARHVYECLDDHAAALNIRGSAWRVAHVRRVEDELLARAELAVFSSPGLAAARRGASARSAVIPLGVDAELFAVRQPRDPNAALGLGRPRLGFVGQVTGREDWAMVERAAEMTPQWQWVVLGPLRGVAPREAANLHWVGEAPYADVPAWLAGWDAAFVPLADSEFNRASWPLKFFECLAAGLAVAATPVPAAAALRDETAGLVVPAADWSAEAFAAAALAALALRPRARAEGPAFAAQHSWTQRAEHILELLG